MLITLSHLSETKLHCCDVAEDDVRAAGQSPSSCQSSHWMTEAWCSVSAPAPHSWQRPGPARPGTHITLDTGACWRYNKGTMIKHASVFYSDSKYIL